ncbi:peptidylprolyl isomerase [Scytonema sp. UIC 10036]|uniref:peptidylprolyl isomerase n=1 Tax=Scytonema sp. UIC 10036 TaxID=2304196 RepID=UPI0012DA8459|nr:peptidylprolyl isomerase [Scytonema sp. UIC 10036]MUG94312.1 peptidylprolyl isomerase [Scytonema sp. UIC 10036]
MSGIITVSFEEIIHQIKLDCQIPSKIEDVVYRQIIISKAEEIGIQVEPKDLQQAADNFRQINQLWNASDTWLWLQKHGLSLDEFEELVRIRLLFSKLAQHLFANKVESFFIENQLNYAQIVMYEVVLDDEDLATELFYAIQEGDMNFHEVAHQYIQDPELRRCGGYLGRLSRKDLKPEISSAVFAATPPQLLQPIVTSKGIHLILVEELIQPELTESLRQNILSNLFLEWLKKEAKQANVVTQLHPQVSGLAV